MRVLICGDRNWADKDLIKHYLGMLKPSLVIEGECRGADVLAREAAKELGIPVSPHPADWEKYARAGKKNPAGVVRNREMLDLEPDLVIAFHDNIDASKGTKDCITEADRRGTPVVLITHEGIRVWSASTWLKHLKKVVRRRHTSVD